MATNSPAVTAGLRTQDAILAIEGTRIRTQAELLEAIGNHAVGEEIDIRLERDGKPLDVTVKLGARPEAVTSSQGCRDLLATPGAVLHLYGKRVARSGRKMGNVTLLADQAEQAGARASLFEKSLRS